MGEKHERNETLDWDLVSVPRWALEEVYNLAGSYTMQVPSRSPKRRDMILSALNIVEKATLDTGIPDPVATMKEVREVLTRGIEAHDAQFGRAPNVGHWTNEARALLAKLGRG